MFRDVQYIQFCSIFHFIFLFLFFKSRGTLVQLKKRQYLFEVGTFGGWDGVGGSGWSGHGHNDSIACPEVESSCRAIIHKKLKWFILFNDAAFA